MKEIHVRPSTLQAIVLPYTRSASGGLQDLRSVQSAVIALRGPNGVAETTVSAVLSEQTETSLILTHQCVDGELTRAGVYTAWGVFTGDHGTPIQGDPQDFRVRERWERINV